MEPFESKQIEIDGHHGAEAQKAFDTCDIEAMLSVLCGGVECEQWRRQNAGNSKQ